MNSRERILQAVKASQPEGVPLPDLDALAAPRPVDLEGYRKVTESMGSRLLEIRHESEIPALVRQHLPGITQVIAVNPDWYGGNIPADWQTGDGRQLQQADLAIVKARLGIAENGALWITEEELQVRVLPFIAQHLAVVLAAEDLVPTMHHAYERIGNQHTGFGVFIAGPSKTADIEQSLVLGAHGAKSLTIFLRL